MNEQAYGIAVLGYVHDALRAESLNVAVVASDADGRDLFVKFTESHERISRVFDGFDDAALAMLRKRVNARLEVLKAAIKDHGFKHAVELVLSDDENGLRVAASGGSVGCSAAEVAAECLKRYVSRPRADSEESMEFSGRRILGQVLRGSSYHPTASNDAVTLSAWREDETPRRLAQTA